MVQPDRQQSKPCAIGCNGRVAGRSLYDFNHDQGLRLDPWSAWRRVRPLPRLRHRWLGYRAILPLLSPLPERLPSLLPAANPMVGPLAPGSNTRSPTRFWGELNTDTPTLKLWGS